MSNARPFSNKRHILQPSASQPVGMTFNNQQPGGAGASNFTGSATANNAIDRELFEKLQTQAAGIRYNVNQGYRRGVSFQQQPGGGFPTSQHNASTSDLPSSSAGAPLFEDEASFRRRVLEEGRRQAAFSRTKSMPLQGRVGELQPLANVQDSSAFERQFSSSSFTSQGSFQRAQSHSSFTTGSDGLLKPPHPAGADEESLSTSAGSMSGGSGEFLEPIALKRGRDDPDAERDDVLAKWAEEDDDRCVSIRLAMKKRTENRANADTLVSSSREPQQLLSFFDPRLFLLCLLFSRRSGRCRRHGHGRCLVPPPPCRPPTARIPALEIIRSSPLRCASALSPSLQRRPRRITSRYTDWQHGAACCALCCTGTLASTAIQQQPPPLQPRIRRGLGARRKPADARVHAGRCCDPCRWQGARSRAGGQWAVEEVRLLQVRHGDGHRLLIESPELSGSLPTNA